MNNPFNKTWINYYLSTGWMPVADTIMVAAAIAAVIFFF